MLKRMLRRVSRSSHPARDRAMILLSVKARLRACEIAGLDWSMVLDAQGRVSGTIHVRDVIAKKRGGRRIPMHPDLRRALERLARTTEPIGPVIRSYRGSHLKANSVVNWFVALFRELGYEGCSSHSGRRSFITMAARNIHRSGCSLRDVQLLPGHRSIETTERYIDADTFNRCIGRQASGSAGLKSMTATREPRDEAQMIAAILAGDTQLYHQLIRPYERSVYMMALSYMKNEADAEDVAQEAFLKAFHHLASFRSESKFSTWLVGIALNEARSRLRRDGVLRMDSLDDTTEDGGHIHPAILRDWREVPSEALERKEVRQMLQKAITGLPEKYREVFILRDVEEMDIFETAAALSITVANVKVRLHRARLMLQKQLSPLLKNIDPKRRWVPWF